MMRWIATVLLAVPAAAYAHLISGAPFAPNVDAANAISQFVGTVAGPFLFAALAIWIYGLIREKGGRFHRRSNWMASVFLVLSIVGNSANKAG